jgi:hypothetical protein
MHPKIRCDFALLRELDHVDAWRIARRPARPAFQRRFKFPDRRIAARANTGPSIQALTWRQRTRISALLARLVINGAHLCGLDNES